MPPKLAHLVLVYKDISIDHLRKVCGSLYGYSLLELLIVEFFRCQIHLFTTEVFDSEAHTTQFDGVKLLNLVIKFAFRVLERAHYKPKTVDRFFFSISISMFNIKSL